MWGGNRSEQEAYYRLVLDEVEKVGGRLTGCLGEPLCLALARALAGPRCACGHAAGSGGGFAAAACPRLPQRPRSADTRFPRPPQDAKAGGPLQGALFWTWYAPGQRAPAEEGGNAGGLYGARVVPGGRRAPGAA